MNKYSLISVLVPLSLVSVSNESFASDGTGLWNYISVSYEDARYENVDSYRPTGYDIKASYEISDHLFLQANYSMLNGNVRFFFVDYDLDLTSTSVSIGTKYAFADKLTGFGMIGIRKKESDAFSLFTKAFKHIDGRDSTTQNSLTAGLVYNKQKNLDLYASYSFLDKDSDIDASESETVFESGFNYKINKHFGVTGSLEFHDKGTYSSFGFGYYF